MDAMTNSLAFPMLDMMLLTMLVWIYMFIQRVGYARANQLDIESMKSPQDVAGLIPPENSSASNNFKNLFELPVLFYAVCLYLMVVEQADQIHLYCAWAFVGLRWVHSLIHCTYNRVLHRFVVYLLSALALWVMVLRAVMGVL